MVEFLLCGEIHYFRVPKQLWYDRLLKLKRSGANCVSTYIPWNWHMPVKGLFDVDDTYSNSLVPGYFSRKLKEYLELAGQLGLRVVVRPGPYICSEWDSGGHPNWIYTEKCKLRSLDPCYMDHVIDWYKRILPVIAEYVEKGIVAVVQVENEYFWGNEPYIEKLREEVLKHIRNVPIVTNENWYIEKIPNTIDDYPSPWNIESFDKKIEKYLSSQPGLFKMFMELEGGWFSSTKCGTLPTNRLSIPADWTELLIKTAFIRGLNNINIYMFHGGTNPGYYTAKYITSSYDYDAAIREWGFLSQKYFNVKRVYMFLETFKEVLRDTRPSENVVKASLRCGEVFARSGSNSTLVLLRNTSDTLCYQRLVYRGEVLPSTLAIRVPPRRGKFILVDTRLPGSPFKFKYVTLEPLLYQRVKNTWITVFYGDPGEEAEIEITVGKALFRVITRGDVGVAYENSLIKATTVISENDKMLVIETSDREKLVIIMTCRRRAERTWFIEYRGIPLIMVSNMYYAGRVEVNNGKLTVEVELDNESCGRIIVITPLELREVYANGSKLEVFKLHDGIYEFTVNSVLCRSRDRMVLTAESVQLEEDPLNYGYVRIDPYTPLENAGFYENGVYTYRVRFNLTSEKIYELKNRVLAVTGVFDYAIVSLNNVYLASGYHVVDADAGVILKDGLNELKIIVEATGHPNDGLLYVPNGITTGIYLGLLEVKPLTDWKKIDLKPNYSPRFDIAEFLENPVEVLDVLKRWKKVIGINVVDIDLPGLYVKEVVIENADKHYIFDPGATFYTNHYYRVLLFVNGLYIGPVTGPIEISRYLKPGVNEIALYVEYGILTPVLRIYEYMIEGEWLVQKSTAGLVQGWFKPEYELPRKQKLPVKFMGSGGRVFWVKTSFTLNEQPDSSKPVKLVVKFSGLRILAFVNGYFVGRLYDDSPSKELYIPEVALKPGENTIALLCLVCSNLASIDEVELSEYYVHRKIELEYNIGYK